MTWSRSSLTLGGFRHDLLYSSPTGSLPVTNVTITANAPLDFAWSGSVDGSAVSGAIRFFEGDADSATYVAFYDSQEILVLGFELPSTGLVHIGITITSDPALRCLCWPPVAVTCTPAQCNDNVQCAAGGSAYCQWRYTQAGSM